MIAKVIKEEIKRFLNNSNPEVLCIKGKWGVGKTYAWNSFLREIIKEGSVKLKKYSYVSLFGISNLSDLKYSLFENTIDIEDLEDGPSVKSLEKGFNLLKKGMRKVSGFVATTPFIESYIGNSENHLFFTVRNQIVCIDDFERADETLTTKEILGIISFLKERRGCKIILLMNEEELDKDRKTDFEKQLEKVIDSRFDYKPTAKESAGIVFPAPNEIEELIYKNCIALGIVNIRVIKRIEQKCLNLIEMLGEKYSNLRIQAIHTITLFQWAILQPKEAPKISYIKDFNRLHGLLFGNDKLSEEEKIWQTLLQEYNFTLVDEFDLYILSSLENGYFDQDNLDKILEKISTEKLKEGRKESFSHAWDLYRDSFSANEKEVLDTMYATAKENIDILDPLNLSHIISFLKEFNHKDRAEELLYLFIKSHPEKESYDIEGSLFTQDIKDEDMKAVFKRKYDSFTDNRDPADVLVSIVTNRGWNPGDIDLISKLEVGNFKDMFKGNTGTRLHQIIRGALQFRNIANISEKEQQISQKAEQALKEIAGESEINRRRVVMHGVTLEDAPADA